MKNRLWIITSGVILVNFALVLCFRRSLPEILPFHISLDGSYASTMPYTRLFTYPATSFVLATGIYLLASIAFRLFPALNDSKGIRMTTVDILVLGLALIILSSTCVSLTMGKVHFFMFAEPVILLLMIAAAIIGEIQIRKSK